MLETKMLSFMKWTKDTHNTPPPDSTIASLTNQAYQIGCTHAEIATVLGMPNWVTESKRWSDSVHGKGMKVTWRNADRDMEGLYGATKAVGPNRMAQQVYIDRAVAAITNNPSLFADGDEWAIYPERTEGIFQDATSWIWPNDPGTFATFFNNLADACAAAFTKIGKKVTVALTSNNGSELLSGWMAASLINRAGYVCVDHYVDGNPTQLDTDIRAMKTKYGKPVYLQESAPSRLAVLPQTAVDAYFATISKLVADGVLTRYGYWGGWIGTPEAIFNADFSLNAQGLGLQKLFGGPPAVVTPPPVTPPTPPSVSLVDTDPPFKWKQLVIGGVAVGKIKVYS